MNFIFSHISLKRPVRQDTETKMITHIHMNIWRLIYKRIENLPYIFFLLLFTERDKYKDQYSALFKQHQQSFDNIQMLQNERKWNYREIQKLSVETRVKSELSSSELVQDQPDSENLPSSSSTPRAPSPVNLVMEELHCLPFSGGRRSGPRSGSPATSTSQKD